MQLKIDRRAQPDRLTVVLCSWFAQTFRSLYGDQLTLMLHRHQYHHAQSCQSRARPSQLQVQSWRRPSWSTEPPVHSGTPDNIRRARQRSSVLRWNHALLVSRGANNIAYTGNAKPLFRRRKYSCCYTLFHFKPKDFLPTSQSRRDTGN